MATDTLPASRVTPPRLEDPRHYVRVPRVPILDRHLRQITNPETGETRVTAVDKDQLQVICNNSNNRANRGDLALITIGHTDRRKPEHEQPPLVGYLKDFIVGQHNGEPTILADLYIKAEENQREVLANFPRRSVEVWNKTLPNAYIDILALLRRAPERDLGLVTHHSKPYDLEYFECSCDKQEKTTMPLPPSPDSDVDPTEGKPASPSDPDPNPDPANPPQDNPAEPNESEPSEEAVTRFADAIADRMVGRLIEHDDFHQKIAQAAAKFHASNQEMIDAIIMRISELLETASEQSEGSPPKNEPEKLEGGTPMASPPSGTNTYVPSSGNEEVEKMSKETDNQIAVLTKQVEDQQKLINQLLDANKAQQEQFSKNSRRIRLEGIRRSGVDVDVDGQLELMEKLDDSTFEAFAKNIETNFPKIPVNNARLETAYFSMIPENPAAETLDSELTKQEFLDGAVEKFRKENNIPIANSTDGGTELLNQYFEKADRSKYGVKKKTA